MAFVLDASVTLSWLFEDQTAPVKNLARERLRHEDAFVASVWPCEVMNGLLSGEREKKVTPAEVDAFLLELHQMAIIVDVVPFHRLRPSLMPLARQFGLSAHDAAYLELASRTGLPLASTDKAMNKAAVAFGVPLLAG